MRSPISTRWVKGGNRLPLDLTKTLEIPFVDQDGKVYQLGYKMFGKYKITQGDKTMFWDADQTDKQFKDNQFKLI